MSLIFVIIAIHLNKCIFTFNSIFIADDDTHLVPSDMSNECIAQAWFRMLHTLGNPVDLCRPEVISQTPKFYHFALSSEMVIDPCQHPCLALLPQIFYKAMKGVSTLVDVFLGKYRSSVYQVKILFFFYTVKNVLKSPGTFSLNQYHCHQA